MESLTISRSDIGFNLAFTVQKSDGTAQNIGSYTVTLKVWTMGDPSALVLDEACTEDIAASGTTHYTVQSGDFETLGHYRAELELTKTDVKESTELFEIVVVRSG